MPSNTAWKQDLEKRAEEAQVNKPKCTCYAEDRVVILALAEYAVERPNSAVRKIFGIPEVQRIVVSHLGLSEIVAPPMFGGAQ